MLFFAFHSWIFLGRWICVALSEQTWIASSLFFCRCANFVTCPLASIYLSVVCFLQIVGRSFGKKSMSLTKHPSVGEFLAGCEEHVNPYRPARLALCPMAADAEISDVSTSDTAREGDFVILWGSYTQIFGIVLKHGEIANNRFGNFHHDEIIGRHFGIRVRSRRGVDETWWNHHEDHLKTTVFSHEMLSVSSLRIITSHFWQHDAYQIFPLS